LANHQEGNGTEAAACRVEAEGGPDEAQIPGADGIIRPEAAHVGAVPEAFIDVQGQKLPLPN
jgi:hypothetical protein